MRKVACYLSVRFKDSLFVYPPVWRRYVNHREESVYEGGDVCRKVERRGRPNSLVYQRHFRPYNPTSHGVLCNVWHRRWNPPGVNE